MDQNGFCIHSAHYFSNKIMSHEMIITSNNNLKNSDDVDNNYYSNQK